MPEKKMGLGRGVPPTLPEGTPRWALGINAIVIALLSVALALGLEGIGSGLSNLITSQGRQEEIQQLTMTQMLYSVQEANRVMQTELVQEQQANRELRDEYNRLRSMLEFQCNIVVTPQPTPGAPHAAPLPTFVLPTVTPTADPLGSLENSILRALPQLTTQTPTATLTTGEQR